MPARKSHPTADSLIEIHAFFNVVLPKMIEKNHWATKSKDTYVYVKEGLKGIESFLLKHYYKRDYSAFIKDDVFYYGLKGSDLKSYDLKIYLPDSINIPEKIDQEQKNLVKEAPNHDTLPSDIADGYLLQGDHSSPVFYLQQRRSDTYFVYHQKEKMKIYLPKGYVFLREHQQIQRGDLFFNLHTLRFQLVTNIDCTMTVGSNVYIVIRKFSNSDCRVAFVDLGVVACLTVARS